MIHFGMFDEGKKNEEIFQIDTDTLTANSLLTMSDTWQMSSTILNSSTVLNRSTVIRSTDQQ